MEIEDRDFKAYFKEGHWEVSWRWKGEEPILKSITGCYEGTMEGEMKAKFEEEVEKWISEWYWWKWDGNRMIEQEGDCR